MPLNADCKTISTGPDNGFLECAAGHLGNPPLNNTNSQVPTNLLRCIGAAKRSAMIIGHGNVGFFKTGHGDNGGTPDQFMGYFNIPQWSNYINQLKGKCTEITILACDTGAGDEGADFLLAMANAAQCPVHASTYLVWCGPQGVYLDAKSQWQTATPGHRPNPIPKPALMMRDIKFLAIKPHNTLQTFTEADITGMALTRINIRGERNSIELSSDEAKGFARLIAFDEPIVVDARPAAIVTGELTMTVGGEEHSFVIYNSSLLESVASPGTFYETTSSFSQALTHLL
jgi:hypothetical protein